MEHSQRKISGQVRECAFFVSPMQTNITCIGGGFSAAFLPCACDTSEKAQVLRKVVYPPFRNKNFRNMFSSSLYLSSSWINSNNVRTQIEKKSEQKSGICSFIELQNSGCRGSISKKYNLLCSTKRYAKKHEITMSKIEAKNHCLHNRTNISNECVFFSMLLFLNKKWTLNMIL